MSERMMILPARDFDKIRLLRIPEDFSQRDALRHVTALIATVEEESPEYTWDDIAPVLEDHGFVPVDFELGPEID
jgi:hypothetical protein